MNRRLLAGYVLALAIGVICRLSAVPLPAPPALIGALVVVAMTCGYLVADRLMPSRRSRQRANSGGPVGN